MFGFYGSLFTDYLEYFNIFHNSTEVFLIEMLIIIIINTYYVDRIIIVFEFVVFLPLMTLALTYVFLPDTLFILLSPCSA